ncbi:MAG: hypothetical protein F4X47_07150 [Gammaproteobacteria bacterium]|nr:hypothetical protein [Gammaproteobacteria bacterium]MYC52075.1 hypothetical protein [Gammaproteobacteria bacterium]
MRPMLTAWLCLGWPWMSVSLVHGKAFPGAPGSLGDIHLAGEATPAMLARQVAELPPGEPRITATFVSAPLRDVLFTFSEFAGISIVPGADVSGIVSADIRDQPWDEALRVILDSHGLAARELENGILRVDDIENLNRREDVEPLETGVFHMSYATAADLLPAAQSLLSDRGSASLSLATNSVIVMDVPRVLAQVEALVGELDIRAPQITISARIVFVNRTGLEELGVAYDLRDSRGHHLLLPSGAADPGEGTGGTGAEAPGNEAAGESVSGDMVLLDGSSISALGNAATRISGSALSVLTSLVLGRHTLLAFLEALETLNLSRMEAAPYISVLDNQTARILVGERTPIRVLDAGAGSAGGLQSPVVPTAAVEIQETGIVFEVTPHVTEGGQVLLDLHAERSFAEFTPAASDAGVIFHTQEASSRVLVRDGETVVIGGLTVTEEIESRSGIPLLMRIPVLGALFRVDRRQTIQRDLVILVTPYIEN